MIKLKNLLTEQQHHTGPVDDHTQITDHPKIKNKLGLLHSAMLGHFEKHDIDHAGDHVDAHAWFSHAHKEHNPFHVEYHDGDIHVAYKKGDTIFTVNIPELSHDSHGGHSDPTAYHDPTHGNLSVGIKRTIGNKKK